MIQGVAAIIIGLVFLLIGLGKAPVSKNPEANQAFVKKWGIFFQIAGPIVMAVGIGMCVASLM